MWERLCGWSEKVENYFKGYDAKNLREITHSQLKSVLLQSMGLNLSEAECDLIFRTFQVHDARLGPTDRVRYPDIVRYIDYTPTGPLFRCDE